MDGFWDLMFGIMNNDYDTAEKVGRDTIEGYTVDTCCTCDCGWETAVWKGNDISHMIIVDRYPSKEAAEMGHQDWCAAVRLHPTQAWSVQTDSYESF